MNCGACGNLLEVVPGRGRLCRRCVHPANFPQLPKEERVKIIRRAIGELIDAKIEYMNGQAEESHEWFPSSESVHNAEKELERVLTELL